MTTLAPYIARYLRGRVARGELKAATARDLDCRLRSFDESFGNRPLRQLGPAAIERWQRHIGHLSAATRRAYLSTVGVFCRWLVKEHLLESDPTRDLAKVRQPRSVPRALGASDVERVLSVLPDSRARCICWLMVGLGLRRAEVANLQVGDYDQQAAIVTVTGKSDHRRVVPVPPEAAAAIDEYIAEVGAPYGPLIRSTTVPTAPLQPGTVGKMVSRWMLEAGVKHYSRDGVSSHAFRHTAASDVLDKCHDLRVVQQMLGHTHLSSSAIYLRRANLDDIREAMSGRTYNRLGVRRGRKYGSDEPNPAVDAPEVAVELDARPKFGDHDPTVGDAPVPDAERRQMDVMPSIVDEQDRPNRRHFGVDLHARTIRE